MPYATVRPAAVAGQFYPAGARELRSQIDDFLDRAPDVEESGDVIGLVAPHAGYPYSGQIAAAAWRQVRGRHYDTVVLASPSHFEPCGGAAVFPGQAYETPLGAVRVDVDTAAAIADETAGIHLAADGHRVRHTPLPDGRLRGEHAIEVHLPFLQVVLGDVPIVPVVMDAPGDDIGPALAGAIVRATRGRRTLLVASSDLYHGEDYGTCVASDGRTLDLIAGFDPAAFSAGVYTRRAAACGAGPIAALMRAAAALGADAARVVARTNSNDVTGRRGGYVVGYGAVVFYRMPPSRQGEPALTEEDRRDLLHVAQEAVRDAAFGRPARAHTAGTAGLAVRAGAFVTLWKNGDLRGCIGDLHGPEELVATVARVAREAALFDPRFPPVRPEEVDHLDINISVLSPLSQVTAPSQIEVGVHGILVRRGPHQGVLLPEVPVRLGWGRARFLEAACAKAGLPKDAWQHPDTDLFTFTSTHVSAE